MNVANAQQPTTQSQWPQQQTLTIQRTIQQPLDQRQVIWSQQSPVIFVNFFLFSLLGIIKIIVLLAWTTANDSYGRKNTPTNSSYESC